MFDPDTRRIVPFDHPAVQRDANCLMDDGRYLWIGYINNGLVRVDYQHGGQTEFYSTVTTDSSTLSHSTIFSMCKTHDDQLLVGTQYGINRYVASKNVFKRWRWSETMQINDMLEDGLGRIWVATAKEGLFCYNPLNEKLLQYANDGTSNALPNNFVTCLYLDHLSRLWVGTTGGGLCLFDEAERTFRVFDKSDGMPSDIVYSIEEDLQGNLWVGTNKALVRLSPKGDVRCYDSDSGLQGNSYNVKACYFDPARGLLFEGGANGFNVMSPGLLDENRVPPIVTVSEAYLDNRPVGGHESADAFARDFLSSNPLTVDASHTSVGFDLTAMSYVAPHHNAFAYYMEHFDERWNESQGQTHISYNLPPGDYVLRLKAANNSGLWGAERRLPIRVLPPTWRSLPMLVLYLLLAIVSLVGLSLRLRRNRRRRHNLEKLRYEVAKEKELYNSKIKFFINIAHDIRIPLSLIQAPVEMALKNTDADSPIRENLETVQRNTERLKTLVNQIMDFNKIGRDEFYFNFEMCDIVYCVAHTCRQFEQPLMLNHIRFETDLPEGTLRCWMDKESVTKLIYNLLSNAMKYAKDMISLKLSAEGSIIRIAISNNGEAITPEFQEKIFLPFYQIKDNGTNQNEGGSGIGLTIVKHVVEKHGGHISVQSGQKQTTFIVEIPYIVKEDAENQIAAEPSKHETGKNVRYTVLVVEDEMELLQFISKNLAERYTVFTARNGNEALKILDGQKVDLVVTDVMMDEMDGLELCRYVRSKAILCHLPVIMLTARTDLSSKISGIEHGADLYVEKPFSMDLLQTQIAGLLHNRELVRRLFEDSIFMPPQTVSENMDDVKFMENLNALIEKYLDTSDGLIELLADKMSMSRSNMHKKIKALSGMTPNDYIQLIRLKKAAQLLGSTNYKINEISSMTGFNTPSYFSKCFYNQFGVLPKEFMRNKNTNEP